MDNHCRCALKAVDFEALTKQWGNTPYRLLVQEHVRKTDGLIEDAVRGILEGLYESEVEVISQLFEHFYVQAGRNDFWKNTSAAQVLSDSTQMLNGLLQKKGIEVEGKVLFAGFQFVTMNFAGIARESKSFRKAIGIRKGLFSR